ncbi:hypothetical protein [Halomonas piscis]|uniref:hypothetical protein n=1 Tax=Halomonas piscis TaxID=3031727 RepID=UPI0028977EC2|nr:hypothetical protein [Halomonas piscis]
MALQRKITLCWPNHAGAAALSGGGWSANMPLAHLADPAFAVAAESVDADPANTQFDLTFPRFLPVGVIALASHNLTVDAEWRVRLWRDTAATDLSWDSGWMMAWPSVYSSSELEWEYDNFWLGTVDEAQRGDFTALTTHFADEVQIVRRVTVEISDTANPDGVIRLGRAFVGDTWQPEYNAAYGIQYGHEIGTEFEVAGNPEQTEYADVRAAKRTVQFALEHLSEEEGFRRTLALQRAQGLHGEVLYSEGGHLDALAFQRTFIGRLSSIDPLAHPYFATYSNSISLKEIL